MPASVVSGHTAMFLANIHVIQFESPY